MKGDYKPIFRGNARKIDAFVRYRPIRLELHVAVYAIQRIGRFIGHTVTPFSGGYAL